MNKYLMSVSMYFGGDKEFTIEALDKNDALENAKLHIKTSKEFDNCKIDTLRVIKKLKKN